MMYLYSIVDHPTNLRPLLRVWEIVKTTNKTYHIQPRFIPNERAMNSTIKIKKSNIEHSSLPKREYYFSAQEAMDALISRQKDIIRRAKSSIELAEQKILEVTEDIPMQMEEIYQW